MEFMECILYSIVYDNGGRLAVRNESGITITFACGCNGLKDLVYATRGEFYGVLASEDAAWAARGET